MNIHDQVWKEALHDRLNNPPTEEVQDEFVGLNPEEPTDDQMRQPDGIEGLSPTCEPDCRPQEWDH